MPAPALVPSVQMNAVAATAVEDLIAATGESRRTLWMRYLRTRQEDCRGATKRSAKAGALEKMPPERSAKVSGNINYYFEMWLRCGCSWGAVVATEKRHCETRRDNEVDYEWMYGFRLKDFVHEHIDKVWMEAMKDDPTFCKPDTFLPDDADAAVYKILKWHLERFKSTDMRSQSVELTANVAETGAAGKQEAADFMQDAGALSSFEGAAPEKAAKSPEVLAAEAAQRQKLKEERELERNKPASKCRRWLANLPKDVMLIKKALTDIQADTHLPQAKRESLHSEFTAHLETLTRIRTTLEDALAQDDIKLPDLATAAAEVISMRQSYQSMKAQMKVYSTA